MPPVKKTPASPAPSNVHALKAAPAPFKVQPPDDWVLEGQFGHMAFEAGEGGRLVRLADVLRWLESSREIPRDDALQVLCSGMPAGVMGWLYWVQHGTRAKPVPADHLFGYRTPQQVAARKDELRISERKKASEASWGVVNNSGYRANIFNDPTPQRSPQKVSNRLPSEPGQPALLKYLQYCWTASIPNKIPLTDGLDNPNFRDATPLAIRLDKAHALWGYGVVTVQAALEAAEAPRMPSRIKGSAWSDEEHARLLAAYEETTGQTEQAKRIALGKSWGMKPDNVKKQVAIAREKTKKKAETARERMKFPCIR